MHLPQEIIRKKRDGRKLSADEIKFMVSGFATGSVPDYQMSALAMAIFLNGFQPDETAELLKAMIASGTRYEWSEYQGKRLFVDKHSTGGVGDKTSLVILPLLVADGLDVPMVAGRGLGHTGGTLDKLESLPGFKTQVDPVTFKRWIHTNHGAFGGQTDDFVPADKRLYALRDVTATVESEALITASIMSKKLAEGLDALVLDVKFGSGAFMSEFENAVSLARALVDVGRQAGCSVNAALTNMDEPLGRTAGNALEVVECLDILQNLTTPHVGNDTRELSLQLAARVAASARGDDNEAGHAAAYARMQNHLTSGRAYEIFVKTAINQGANSKDVERKNTSWSTTGTGLTEVHSSTPGVVAHVDTRELGLAILELGGGRRRKEDVINYQVGLSGMCKIGEVTGKGAMPLCVVHAAQGQNIESVLQRIQSAYTVVENADRVRSQPLIREWM